MNKSLAASLTESRPPGLQCTPQPGMRSAFVQSFLASFKLRRWLNNRRVPGLESNSTAHTLDAGDGVRLTCHVSAQADNVIAPTIVLVHGWEGSHESIYLHSLACHLYERGWQVVRFNLRDHGGTHDLNPEPFHSARMDEVFGGLRAIQSMLNCDFDLAGFSLGGNFVLRTAIGAPAQKLRLRQVIAVNPAVNPHATTKALDQQKIYLPYFMRKWRQTVQARTQAWPDGPDYADLLEDTELLAVTAKFATQYCGFESVDHYFDQYWLRPGHFANLQVPTTIITAANDALVPVADIAQLAGSSPHLNVEISEHGGHCGFVANWALQSWLDPYITRKLAHHHDPLPADRDPAATAG